jgi:hypothetical protein
MRQPVLINTGARWELLIFPTKNEKNECPRAQVTGGSAQAEASAPLLTSLTVVMNTRDPITTSTRAGKKKIKKRSINGSG